MRRVALFRNSILIAGIVALAFSFFTGSAAASQCGCFPGTDEAQFSPDDAIPGQQVNYSYHYVAAGCACVPVACAIGPDEEYVYPTYETQYSYELWWGYGTPQQILLDSGTTIFGGSDAVGFGLSVNGSFIVPADAKAGTHNINFLIENKVTQFCEGIQTDISESPGVILSHALTVRNAERDIIVDPRGSIKWDANDADLRLPGRETSQPATPSRLPNTGSRLDGGLTLVLLGLALLFHSYRWKRRDSTNR
jgi:hypothetical protein